MIRAHTHSQGKRGLSGLDYTFLDNWLVVWFRTTDWEECRFGLGLDFCTVLILAWLSHVMTLFGSLAQ